jgi:hypothetical protein
MKKITVIISEDKTIRTLEGDTIGVLAATINYDRLESNRLEKLVMPKIAEERIKQMFVAYPGHDRFIYKNLMLEEEVMQDINLEQFIKVFRDNGY